MSNSSVPNTSFVPPLSNTTIAEMELGRKTVEAAEAKLRTQQENVTAEAALEVPAEIVLTPPTRRARG